MIRLLWLTAGALAAALSLALPGTAGAAPWTAPDAASVRGSAFQGGVAIDPRGRLAVGFNRRLADANRAELRTGTMRAGLRGGSVVLDRDADHSLEPPAIAWPAADGTLAVGWRFLADRNRRIRGATVTPDRRVAGARDLSGAGESAYEPRFVPGTSGNGLLLAWARRTTNEVSTWDGGDWSAARPLPGEGIGSFPALAQDPDGTLVAAWTVRGDVFVAQARRGEPFAPAQAQADDGGYARDISVALNRDGDAVVAWIAADGTGNGVFSAVRPRGGTFGATRMIEDHDAGARSPVVAASSAGAFGVAYTTTSSRLGYGLPAGVARLQILRPDGEPVGPRIRLSAGGDRTREVALADDGTSALHAAWSLAGRGAGIHARRIAPGPITGRLRTVSRRDVTAPPVLAGGQGGTPSAALAFSWDERVYVARYFGD